MHLFTESVRKGVAMSPVHPPGEAATARAVIDDNGILMHWNEDARRLLGYAPGEAEGRPAAELLVPGSPVPRAEPDGTRWSGTVQLRHHDGGTLPMWLLGHHRPQEHGGAWLVVTPLGDLDRLLEDDRPLRTALNWSPCALAVFDGNLRLYACNEAMADLVGLPRERRGHGRAGSRRGTGLLRQARRRLLGER
ncbi:PAS domain-containing protein, partial [Streptomyces sp. NPDC001215]